MNYLRSRVIYYDYIIEWQEEACLSAMVFLNIEKGTGCMKRKLNKIEWKPLILAVAIPLAVGGAAAIIARSGFRGYDMLRQPPLSPPAWLFPVVWTILYIMMGAASYLVCVSDKYPGRVERALTAYAVQLLMNFCWTLIFFNLKLYLAAFIWLVLMLILIAWTAIQFGFISKPAGLLMLPYLLWVAFAGYLNMGVNILN